MTDYDTQRDVNHPYWSSQVISNFAPIYPDFWRGQPLEDQPLIDPRRSGFRPYVQYQAISNNPEYLPKCPSFQLECDLILPVNECYRKSPQDWLSEIFQGR